MTYDLLIVGDLDGVRLRAALAALAAVPVEEVDVSGVDAAGRHWEAAVLCTIAPVGGDVTAALDVSLRTPGPPVERAAAQLAAALGVLVLHPAQAFPPSAHWLVTPDGTRTRARVYEQDTSGLVIDAVAEPVAMLPATRVEPQPEVIREHRMPTPVTESFRAARPDVAPAAVDRLGAWEAAVARLVAGWPPDGWYPVSYWEDDLAVRDRLAADAALLGSALDTVDGAFRAASREVERPGETRWWRLRIPEPPPSPVTP